LLGDKQSALSDFNKAISINPNEALAYANRGRMKAESGDKQGARMDLQKAAEFFKQQGDTKRYNAVTNLIEQL